MPTWDQPARHSLQSNKHCGTNHATTHKTAHACAHYKTVIVPEVSSHFASFCRTNNGPSNSITDAKPSGKSDYLPFGSTNAKQHYSSFGIICHFYRPEHSSSDCGSNQLSSGRAIAIALGLSHQRANVAALHRADSVTQRETISGSNSVTFVRAIGYGYGFAVAIVTAHSGFVGHTNVQPKSEHCLYRDS
jgi:hypothetical protein